ncbi:MAG: RHS repeat-associated core domain-containing protein [Polyangiaceae bacterium]|nr:RHS repeat-associated core domain-containing protein [Polyangiaceae bacterium]
MGGSPAQIVYNEATGVDETLYLHSEALGSVGLVTDNQGVETERTFFDPFGEKVKASGDATYAPWGDVKLGFTGHRHDDDLGLINMVGRIYSPVQKRFLSTDPMISDPFFGQSYNRYSYVVNNPLRYTDPTGYQQAPPKTQAGATNGEQPTERVIEINSENSPAKWELLGEWTLVVAKLIDDTGQTVERHAPKAGDSHLPNDWKEYGRFLGAFGAGIAKHVLQSVSPVPSIVSAVQAVGRVAKGEVRPQVLDNPQQLLSAWTSLNVGAVVAPIKGVLSVPANIQTAADPDQSPEDRGAAAADVAETIVNVVATVVSAGGGKGGSSPDTKAGNSAAKAIGDDANVVRGGIATPDQIAKGTGPHRNVPDLSGFSAQSRNGATVTELAANGGVGGGPFPHGKVSVTTAGKLRGIGCEVVPSPGAGANHVTVVPGGASPAEISQQFVVISNPGK